MKSKKLKGLSFFSGAMGLDLGLESTGIDFLLACEVDKSCKATIAKNKPDLTLIGDIRDYTAKEIRKEAGLSKNEDIDLMVGGPPCQAFSSAGKRQGFNDERGNVFLTFIDHIINLKPRFAVLENVRGLLSCPIQHRPHDQRGAKFSPLSSDEEKGGALFHILQSLTSAGYGVSFNLYNSANFGCPQKRERVVIICSRDGKELPFLSPTHSENGSYGLPKWKSVREAFKGLSRKKHDFIEFPERRLKYYRMLKPGQYWKHLPENLQKEAMGASYFSGGGKTGFYRRLPWDKPSPTLVTHPAMPATDLAHPTKDRPLSIQEYKVLQEFPNDWELEGSLINQYKQIGNAVPLSLGRAIGKLLTSHMNKKSISVLPNFPYSRYRNTDHASWMKQFKKNKQEEKKQLSIAFG
ncbi:MAG: DNA cytosine methyltransferase [Nitrospina sp.]|jgi:DNA (cytosine-5)-methyltransferase 1|nr:DNA cytosine methyltransferase [Nitrospina sp.]MBT4048080.1 DNA cytosine methyltransferase [Nitrospina sp.]MBT4559214.1 DNA cytosine methyltransferase [Nitrospina sp.]MBT6600097.1 DNA cytosine methyltransferase [Nitrospina sp.]MBT7707368.1 DNA cytosine methyltransferase [Nitrospina sp.]